MKTLSQIYTGKIYANDEVLKEAPRNKVQGEIEFFTLGKYVTDDGLEQEYESRGLVPADFYAMANWNEANKTDERKYFATHWKDANGKWCYAAFHRFGDERYVYVYRFGYYWYDGWSFGGVRKSSALKTSAPPSDTKDSLIKKIWNRLTKLNSLHLFRFRSGSSRSDYSRGVLNAPYEIPLS